MQGLMRVLYMSVLDVGVMFLILTSSGTLALDAPFVGTESSVKSGLQLSKELRRDK